MVRQKLIFNINAIEYSQLLWSVSANKKIESQTGYLCIRKVGLSCTMKVSIMEIGGLEIALMKNNYGVLYKRASLLKKYLQKEQVCYASIERGYRSLGKMLP